VCCAAYFNILPARKVRSCASHALAVADGARWPNTGNLANHSVKRAGCTIVLKVVKLGLRYPYFLPPSTRNENKRNQGMLAVWNLESLSSSTATTRPPSDAMTTTKTPDRVVKGGRCMFLQERRLVLQPSIKSATRGLGVAVQTHRSDVGYTRIDDLRCKNNSSKFLWERDWTSKSSGITDTQRSSPPEVLYRNVSKTAVCPVSYQRQSHPHLLIQHL